MRSKITSREKFICNTLISAILNRREQDMTFIDKRIQCC